VVLRDYLWCNGGHGGDDGGLMYCGVCVCDCVCDVCATWFV
jgi:hypothetical protein